MEFLLTNKANEHIYYFRPANQRNIFNNGREKFAQLQIELQCEMLIKILSYFGMSGGIADLEMIGGKSKAGSIKFASKINTNESKLYIIDQSVTGLFENIQEIKA